MKIAHVTEAWNGGVATYINTLTRHQAREHEIVLIYSENATQHDFDREIYERNGIATIPYASSRNPARFLGIAKKITSVLKKEKPDIVHLHSSFPGVYGRLFRHGFPVVYCPHGWSFAQEGGALKKTLYAQVEKFLARRCGAIVHISRHEYSHAQKRGVLAPLNIVIPSGVDDVHDIKTPAGVSVDPSRINIGFIGRLDRIKGFDIAAAAWRKLSRRDIHLYVMGGASRDGYAAGHGDAPNIHYLGWVNNRDIDGYIRLFDALVVPSRQEGFGLVVLEAMRNAKPAIVSDAGALPELVRNGENGYVFASENSYQLAVILESLDKETLRLMGKNARRLYEQSYTAGRMAGDVLGVYESVLSRQGTGLCDNRRKIT